MGVKDTGVGSFDQEMEERTVLSDRDLGGIWAAHWEILQPKFSRKFWMQ
jgi:hypothetical protein